MLSMLLGLAFAFPTLGQTSSSPSPPVWTNCSWQLDRTQELYNDIKCTVLKVPLDYGDNNSALIDFHITRVRHRSINSTQVVPQLWFLNGGPGTPGEWLLPNVAVGSPEPLAQVEFLLPDHRGTGLSSELQCPDGSQNISQTCIDALKNDSRLMHFTITNAAHDLFVGMERLRGQGPITVLGTSYGTMWLNRFLTMFPNAPISSAILDSLVDPTYPHFWKYDAEASEVGVQYLHRCEANTSALWAPLGIERSFRETLDQINNGTQTCVSKNFPYLSGAEGVARIKAKVLFSHLFEATEYYNSRLVPAVIYRLRRCRSDDVEALGTLFDSIPQLKDPAAVSANPSGVPAFVRQSMVLNALIHLSENFSPPNRFIPTASVEVASRNALFGTGAAVAVAHYRDAGFPVYPTDSFSYRLADPSCPVLILNGDLDMATLVKYVQDISLMRPSWFFQPLPNLGHSPSCSAAIGINCVVQLAMQFMDKPRTNPFLSNPCTKELPAEVQCGPDGPIAEAVAKTFFNTTSLYGL